MKRASVSIAFLAAAALASVPAVHAQSRPDGPPGDQGSPANAPGDVRQLSLGQVLEVAIRQEPSLARAAIDVHLADAAILEAQGVDDWVLALTGAGAFSRSRTDRIIQIPLTDDTGLPLPGEEVLTVEAREETQRIFADLAADVSRSFSTGGTLSLRANTSYTRFTSQIIDPPGDPSNPLEIYENSITARFTQPLLRGRGETVARAAQAQASMQRDAAALERQQAAITAIQRLVVAYWELAFAWRDLEIRRGSLALAQEQLRNTQARIRAGAVAPTEALLVQQTIAAREEEILSAELNVTQRSLDLRRLAGLDVGPGDVDLAVTAPLTVSPRQFDTNALLAQTLAQNVQLAALRVRQETFALDVEVAERNLDPQLDLDVSGGSTGSSDKPGDALSNTATFDGFSINAGLTLRHAFGQSTVRGQHKRAREQLFRYQVDVAEAKNQITRDLISAVKQAEIAQKRADISQQVIELAEKNIEAEKARFELGRSTNFEVLTRQEDLKQAQLRQARAIIDVLQAIAAIDAITGDLLASYGINLDPVANR